MVNGTYESQRIFSAHVTVHESPPDIWPAFSPEEMKSIILDVYKKLSAVRVYKRSETVQDSSSPEKVNKILDEAGLTPDKAEAIFRLTSLPQFEERFVIRLSCVKWQLSRWRILRKEDATPA